MTQLTKTQRIVERTFSTHAMNAREVYLAGSFNQWDPAATPMLRGDQGEWTVTMPLAAGRYEYKFIVDGKWCCEPGCEGPYDACPNCVPNECGSMNRVVQVR